MKDFRKSIFALLAACAVTCVLTTQQVQAVPITGDLNLGGSVEYNTTSLATATQVTTWYNVFATPGFASVLGGTGSFSGIVPGTSATMAQPWVFGAATPALWSVGGFTFDLLSSVVVTQTATFLNITGTGVIKAAGFDDTAGMWSFTSSNAGGNPMARFGFTANTTAVPEGGSALALLGLALASVEVLRRKMKKA